LVKKLSVTLRSGFIDQKLATSLLHLLYKGFEGFCSADESQKDLPSVAGIIKKGPPRRKHAVSIVLKRFGEGP
jgi:hypothetical protein